MPPNQFAERERYRGSSLLPSNAFWKLQALGWGAFACLVFVFFWPKQDAQSAFAIQSLRLLLNVFSSFLLYPLCRYAWRRRERFLPVALCSIVCAAILAFVIESVVQTLTHAMLRIPESMHWRSVLTASLRYQFALAAWCTCYFALKSFDRIKEQANLIQQAQIKRREALIASYRYQLPGRFLSDMLHGISRSITKADSSHASLMIARFGGLIRNILEDPERQFATLWHEIAQVSEYLDLKGELLGRKLEIDFEVDDDLSNLLIPRWLLVSLIEELSSSLENADVSDPLMTIKIARSGAQLRLDLVVETPLAASSVDRLGLRFEATRSLLETVFNANVLFELNVDFATLLRIELPPAIEEQASTT
jgi:LytS/YehU family sensor histidine kinase